MEQSDSVSLQIKDAIRLCRTRNKPVFVGFLNEEETQRALERIEAERFGDYLLWGGREGCERVMAGLFPDFIPAEPESFPIKTVKISYPARFDLGHRDFLGSLMGLGIKRSCIGDILTSDGEAYVFLKSEISDYVISQLDKVGRVGVELSYSDISDAEFTDDSAYLNLTASSLRLDGIVSASLKLSREKSAQAVKSGLVSVNHSVKLSPSFLLKEGDSVVLKGKGKFVLEALAGESKKGRKKIIIKKYR